MSERNVNTEIFNQEQLRSVVEGSMPGVTYKEGETLSGNIHALVVLCPLYTKGSLEKSTLIQYPAKITDSRVYAKLDAYFTVISAMNNYLKCIQGNLATTFVIADKGVLLSGQDESVALSALEYHKELYQEAIKNFSEPLGINWQFFDYEELEVDFPKFVNPNHEIPKEIQQIDDPKVSQQWKMIEYLNQWLNLPHEIPNNKKNKKAVRGIVSQIGFTPAFWVVAGYLPFDHLIPEIVGEGGVYLAAERFESLLKISKLTPGLESINKIEIKA